MARPIRVEYANAVYHLTARGNEPMAIYRDDAVAADYGYRDGSGIHRVIQRLEKNAQSDGALARRLKSLATEVSSVKS